MGWHLVERVVDSVSSYATLTGRLWVSSWYIPKLIKHAFLKTVHFVSQSPYHMSHIIWLKAIQKHKMQKLMEKFQTTLLFLLRIVVITSIGEHVYGDEVSAFDCNVKNPGCPNVCYR